MLSQVNSFGLTGLSGFPVKVEAYISGGIHAYETVGLPDAAVKESKERVRSATKNSGFEFPSDLHVTVSLAPQMCARRAASTICPSLSRSSAPRGI